MKLPRFFGLIDIGILTVIAVFVVLPPREMFSFPAHKADAPEQFALALAEARTMARPDDGVAIADLGRRLGDANFKDWAVEVTAHGATRTKAVDAAWRGQLAASVAYVDRLDARPGLEHANLALEACHGTPAACPSWEEVRMSLYQQHLDAGVKSGIDPRRDPKGFRKAGESALRTIHLGPKRDSDPKSPAPTPPPPTSPTDAGP